MGGRLMADRDSGTVALASQRTGATSAEPGRDQPRPEIWFRRRIRVIAALRELWAFRELVLTLAERDLRIRYKQAVLGIAWAVITPVVMMIAFTFIFQKFAHVKTSGAPYALFSYMGLLPWTFFSGDRKS